MNPGTTVAHGLPVYPSEAEVSLRRLRRHHPHGRERRASQSVFSTHPFAPGVPYAEDIQEVLPCVVC